MRSSPTAAAFFPPRKLTGWGERFFPVAPAHSTPGPLLRELTSVEGLPEALGREGFLPEHVALQGTVARSAEVLLLALRDPAEER